MLQELWPGGPRFKEAPGVHKIGADSVLLANFAGAARLKKKSRAADLGCGSGIISILMALGDPGLYIDAVDILPDAVRLASENVRLCELADRITIIEGDLRGYREFLKSGAYDIVVSNPPYNARGSGKRAANTGLAAAREEESCTLDDLCRAAGYLTRSGGAFFMVHRPQRLAGIFRALSCGGFEPKRLRFVQHNIASKPSLVLLESRRGGGPSLETESPLILYREDGSETDEIKVIYKRNQD